ncbi:MAG TPA: hypothetical protein VFI76_05565 [Terrimicrobiaceae bacterium]|nr:hypothetical protein [Terrimicrobiaceae bacterium]
MESILIAVVHGPKNFPDAITTEFSVGQRADPHPIRVCAAAFHGIKEEDQFTQGKWTLRHPLRCPSPSRNWGRESLLAIFASDFPLQEHAAIFSSQALLVYRLGPHTRFHRVR